VAPPLLSLRDMRHPNGAIKEAAMAKKLDLAKLCWTVMALGAVVFLTHSALIAFAR
jgi:hypothetical protein